jgi:hypothetical protein
MVLAQENNPTDRPEWVGWVGLIHSASLHLRLVQTRSGHEANLGSDHGGVNGKVFDFSARLQTLGLATWQAAPMCQPEWNASPITRSKTELPASELCFKESPCLFSRAEVGTTHA